MRELQSDVEHLKPENTVNEHNDDKLRRGHSTTHLGDWYLTSLHSRLAPATRPIARDV